MLSDDFKVGVALGLAPGNRSKGKKTLFIYYLAVAIAGI